MKFTQHAEIRRSNIHRIGVFAKKDLKKGETIEACPFLETHGEEKMEKNHRGIRDYLFGFSKDSTILLLGYGSLYNHSENYNADYYLSDDNEFVIIHATSDIRKGEEIFINYGNRFWDSRSKRPK